jgi:hypothetical protein
MNSEMRHKLAQLPFEQKIRMVGELLNFLAKLRRIALVKTSHYELNLDVRGANVRSES